MSLISDIHKQIEDYQLKYPDEDLSELTSQLEDEQDDRNWPFLLRSNMRGHITCSAFVVNEKAEALLVDHIALKRWLQPGGHWEGDVTLQLGAVREVVEETGLVCSITAPFPLDIDSHAIPANEKKNEGDHVHHDFCYLVEVDSNTALTAQVAEVNDLQWVAATKVAEAEDRVGRMARKFLEERGG